jgi:hypothetical protein
MNDKQFEILYEAANDIIDGLEIAIQLLAHHTGDSSATRYRTWRLRRKDRESWLECESTDVDLPRPAVGIWRSLAFWRKRS